MLAALVVLVAASAAVAAYWFFLFRRLLPLEQSLSRSRGHADDVKIFCADVLSDVPPRSAHEAAHRTLSALHRLVPRAQLWWFERAGNVCRLVDRRGGGWAGVGREGALLEFSDFSDAVAAGGRSYDLATDPEAGRHPFLRALAEQGLRRARLLPWGWAGGAQGLLIAGDADPEGGNLAALQPFLDIVRPLAGSLALIAENLVKLSRAGAALESGLSAALADATEARSRLIDKSREVKTLQDVSAAIASRTSQARSTLGAIVSIVARSLAADTVAFLLLDEATGELVTQPGAYGLESEELFYRIALSEAGSSSVRVFKSGTAFLTGDAQNDPLVLSRYARLWKTRSLMVLPLKVEDHCIGVLRVGSYQKDYFTQDHLRLTSAIAREAAVIVETAMLNRRLADTAEQLTALNRMKDEFVSTVSHEFKTPLTTIMGFLTVILEGETGALTEQQGKFLTIAMGASKRLAGLVSDLLDISRLEGGVRMELRPGALEPVLRESLESHAALAKDAGVELFGAAGERLPQVILDPRWVALAIDNLLSNAVKFTRKGGRVRLEAVDKGEFVMVSVSDEGIGIPAEDRPRIFEKFFRASNRVESSAPGTGLGLAIAKEIVTKHGGKIWFESELGRGTTFNFVLKVARGIAPGLSCLLVLALAAGCAGPLSRLGPGKEGTVVEAEGVVAEPGLSDVELSSRAVALARRRAVEGLLPVFLSSASAARASAVLEARILDRAQEFVVKDKVVGSERAPGARNARIRALVSHARLGAELDRLGLLWPDGRGRPKVIVSLAEPGVREEGEAGRASGALRRALLARGYDVLDLSDRDLAPAGAAGAAGDPQKTAEAARRTEARAVLLGQARTRPASDARLERYHPTTASVRLEVSAGAPGPAPSSVESEATALDLDAEGAAAKALENAGELAGERAAAELAKTFSERIEILAVIAGLEGLAQVERVISEVRGLPGVAAAAVDGMGPRWLRLRLHSERPADELVPGLTRLAAAALRLVEVGGDFLELETEVD